MSKLGIFQVTCGLFILGMAAMPEYNFATAILVYAGLQCLTVGVLEIMREAEK